MSSNHRDGPDFNEQPKPMTDFEKKRAEDWAAHQPMTYRRKTAVEELELRIRELLNMNAKNKSDDFLIEAQCHQIAVNWLKSLGHE